MAYKGPSPCPTSSLSTLRLLSYVPIIMNHLQFPECSTFSRAAMALFMMFLLPGVLSRPPPHPTPPLIAWINFLDILTESSNSSFLFPFRARLPSCLPLQHWFILMDLITAYCNYLLMENESIKNFFHTELYKRKRYIKSM